MVPQPRGVSIPRARALVSLEPPRKLFGGGLFLGAQPARAVGIPTEAAEPAPGNLAALRGFSDEIAQAHALQQPTQGEGNEHLMVLHASAALHRTQIPYQAIMPAAHAGQQAVGEATLEHRFSMHCGAIPSTLDSNRSTPAPQH